MSRYLIDYNGDPMSPKEIAAMCACYALVYGPIIAAILILA